MNAKELKHILNNNKPIWLWSIDPDTYKTVWHECEFLEKVNKMKYKVRLPDGQEKIVRSSNCFQNKWEVISTIEKGEK